MINIYSLDGKVTGKTDLPKVFDTEYRPDIIQRAVVALQSSARQPYGVSEGAGMKSSADYFGRRKGAYRQTINKGMSRLPREKTGGGGLGKVRLIPSSVGGRRAHPPKGRDWTKKINNKEYLYALKSAIAATQNREHIEKRGHAIKDVKEIPMVVEDSLETLSKTKDVIGTLMALGIQEDLERTSQKIIRSGKGKMRGRKYREKKSALIIVNNHSGIEKSARNIPGVDVVALADLNVELLAPGTHAGRLTIWTKSALENLDKMIES
ncbi:MAG: 50S ribosomal protein L4 [Candidatus Altiarchaeota archaeon]|nr:50S ribosomal protein L4 [Candidatus Altiarchaeota archaeon]